jgi:HK97 family phage major capsid protein
VSERLLQVQAALKLAVDVQRSKREALEKDPTSEELIEGLSAANDEVEAREKEEALILRSEEALAAAVAAEKRILEPAPEKPDGLPGHAVTSGVTDAGLRDPSHKFKDYAEFLMCVRTAGTSRNALVDPRLRMGAVTGMGTTVGPDGGFLIPPTFETAIWDGVMADSPLNLISRCDQRTVTGRSITLNADAETSKEDGSRHGGIRGYWLNEGGTGTASAPKFRQLTLKPHKLFVLSYMTEELLDDGPASAQHLERVVADEIAYMSNRAIFRGTGVGQPMGLLNAGGLTTVAVETGQTSGDPLLAENIDKMFARMIPSPRAGAVWLINIGLEPFLQGIGRTVGTGGWPAYMPPGGLSASPYGTLKGLPVLPCEWCSARNVLGDIMFVNLGGYLVGTKGGVRSDSSIHVQFTTDEVAFRFIFRIDGQPWRASELTLEQDVSGETVSDYVTLAARS